MKKRTELIKAIAIRIGIVGLFIVALLSMIAYARGYRISLEDNTGMARGIRSTGIISMNAFPQASKVYIDGKLKGVTDINITLPPGEYTVEVKKEGYTDWKKKIRLKGEIVMTLDALLFPKNPSLISLTNLGIVKAVPYHDTDSIIVFSQNDDPEKDGVYVFSAGSRAISFLPPIKPLILKKNLPADIDLNDAIVNFSPDFQQAIFQFPTATTTYSYLFGLGEEITQPFDISASVDQLLNTWKLEKNQEITKILETFPRAIRPIAAENFSIIGFSPDQTKVLYQAKTTMQIPLIINPSLIGANQSPETRNISRGGIYVYDKKEDKNFAIPFDRSLEIKGVSPTPQLEPSLVTPTPTIPLTFTEKQLPMAWHSDSKHISIQQEREIVMVGYDGENKKTIYSGPFEKNFFTISKEGKLIILINLNPQYNLSADLYEIGIK